MIPYLRKRVRSFSYAMSGAAFLIKSQPHARIHLMATLAALILGFWLGLDRLEWCLLVIAFLAVWTAEGLNTALETLADAVCPEHNALVGRAKDIAAAAVLFAAVGAIALGVLVFGPHILVLFR